MPAEAVPDGRRQWSRSRSSAAERQGRDERDRDPEGRVACSKTGRLASAKPNSTRTRPAKGTTWPNVTRERHSIWRSFVATSRASAASWPPGSRLPRSSEVMVPPATVRWRVARSSVRRVRVRRASPWHPPTQRVEDDLVDQVAAALIETRVRLVKQPEARAANDHRSEGGAAPLPQKIPHRNVTQAFGDAERSSAAGTASSSMRDARAQKRRFSSTVRSS